MSLNNKSELIKIAKVLCRGLRKNSTKAERVLWEELRNKKFHSKKFYRQYPLFHDITGKENFFIADFFCYSDKIIIEIDGKYHQYRLKKDDERSAILQSLGLKLIRFKNEEVLSDVNLVLAELKKYLK